MVCAARTAAWGATLPRGLPGAFLDELVRGVPGLLVSHAVGDVLLQTDWQAMNKYTGSGKPLGRRALIRHVATYMVAFIPTLVWIGDQTSPWRAVGVAALVAVPHLIVDDGTSSASGCEWSTARRSPLRDS